MGLFAPLAFSVPIQNPFDPFTVADATIPGFFPDGSGLPVTTGVQFRGANDTGPRHKKFTYHDYLFDVGLRGEMGEFGDYFKTWNWEMGFRYSRNEGERFSTGEVSEPRIAGRTSGYGSSYGIRSVPEFQCSQHQGGQAKSLCRRCTTQVSMSCRLAMPQLTATYSTFPLGRSHLLLAASMMQRDGRSIVTRSIQRFKALAR